MTLPLVLLNRRRIGGFNPRAILAGSTALFWLDPSDLTTLFQDAAGTTPVTAPGQPVGLALDKSQGLVLGPELVTNGGFDTNLTGWSFNSDWSWSNGSARYISSGFVGAQFIGTQDVTLKANTTYRIGFNNVNVTGGFVNILLVINQTLNNSGTAIFTRILTTSETYSGVFTTGSDTTLHIQFLGNGLTAGQTITIDNISVRELPGFHATASGTSRPTYGVVPSRGRVNILNATATLATQTRPVTAAQHTLSFRGTGTVTLTGASTAGPLVGTGANDIVSLTFTPTAGNLTLTVSGTVNDAQLELGAARGTYQLVSDAGGFNITDPVGFPTYPCHYLGFDGIDDFMVTPTITPNADKVQVFAGVRKLSDAARGMVTEIGADVLSGTWSLNAPNSAATDYSFRSGGTAIITALTSATFSAPTTNVLTGIGDISGDLATLRVNGTQAAQNTADQGTGNYLANPLFIGRRAGTSLPFNGQLFGLIVRFSTANLDASLISQTERWVAQKTPGVTIA